MKRLAAFLAPLAAAALLGAAPPMAHATVGPAVGVRLHSYTPPATPGGPATFEVRLEGREALTLSGFRTSAGAATAGARGSRFTSTLPEAPLLLPRGENRLYSFTVEGDAAEGEVKLEFTANGRPVVKRFDFSRANRDKHQNAGALVSLPDGTLAPEPAHAPGALRAEPAPLSAR
ncbi:MAG: hypothetical protein IT190_09425, partial [Microbacteriaceae bacterium]|nr:hypothetical protein [Microbacteriaceae bacterium]